MREPRSGREPGARAEHLLWPQVGDTFVTHSAEQLALIVSLFIVIGLLGWIVSPGNLPVQAWYMLLVGLAAAVLWMSEVVPLAITSLVVILAVSGLSITSLQESLAMIFHPVSAIVLTGFCLATALQK